MLDQLTLLIQLQALDLQRQQIKGEQEQIPRRLTAAKEALALTITALEKTKTALEQTHKEKREKERELTLCEERITQLKSRLTDLKTNKEYQTHLHEIEAAKHVQSNIEEQILLDMDRVDVLAKALREQSASVTAGEAQFALEREQLEAQMHNALESAQRVGTAWSLQAEGVEPKLLEEYRRLIAQKGLAVAPIKDNICGGCHYRLPPQLITEVRMREKLLACSYCSRFLYAIVSDRTHEG